MHPTERKRTKPSKVTNKVEIKIKPKQENNVALLETPPPTPVESAPFFGIDFIKEVEVLLSKRIEEEKLVSPTSPKAMPCKEMNEPCEKEVIEQPKQLEVLTENEEPMNLVKSKPSTSGSLNGFRWVEQVLPVKTDYNVIMCHGLQKQLVRCNHFPTKLIPYESPYWDQFRDALGPDKQINKVQEFSIHDGVNISAIRFNDGVIRATRLYQTVTIKKRRVKFVESKWFNIIHRELPERITRHSSMPTEMIPWDSPYFAEAAEGLYFPVQGHVWVRRKGCDGVPIEFRLGERGRSLFIYRNGLVIQAYPYPKAC